MRRIGVGEKKDTAVDQLKAENAALKKQIEQLKNKKSAKSKEPEQQ